MSWFNFGSHRKSLAYNQIYQYSNRYPEGLAYKVKQVKMILQFNPIHLLSNLTTLSETRQPDFDAKSIYFAI